MTTLFYYSLNACFHVRLQLKVEKTGIDRKHGHEVCYLTKLNAWYKSSECPNSHHLHHHNRHHHNHRQGAKSRYKLTKYEKGSSFALNQQRQKDDSSSDYSLDGKSSVVDGAGFNDLSASAPSLLLFRSSQNNIASQYSLHDISKV